MILDKIRRFFPFFALLKVGFRLLAIFWAKLRYFFHFLPSLRVCFCPFAVPEGILPQLHTPIKTQSQCPPPGTAPHPPAPLVVCK